MARISLQTPEASPELFAFLQERRGRAATFNIFRAMANCPDILPAFIDMADAVRRGHGIDYPKLRELAIVMTCQTLGTRYEHDRHWNMALELGIEKAKLEQIWNFEKSGLFTTLETSALRLARDATRSPEQVHADTWQAVVSHLGEAKSLALLFSIGWYNLTGRISGVLQIEDEPGFERQ